jgi:hypothetical protein
MAKGKCAGRGRIARLVRLGNATYFCHKWGARVPVSVALEGNKCCKKECPYSGELIPQTMS